ncbi:amidase [Roseococcus sp. YIM B11640]|uniref:amidase n=1 Tax=Roseococcus sp. YIM B11640 TaxID=3133973 RepID=UPI003C7A348D
MTEPCDLTAVEARRLIGSKKLSATELLESCLTRIAKVNPAVNAMTAMDEEAARATAKAADAATMKGDKLPLLHGLPIGIKDLEETKGLRTTWGSPIFANHVPDKDEHMVANLRAHGGVVVGKTNVPEFGLGANSRNLVWGATGNAFNPEFNAAGSSGGSAVALATNMVPLASGSDTGGSLRNPAAFNGIIGYRPSSGLVPSSRRAHGWSPLPMLGPMARNTADLALMLGAMASDDSTDPLAYTYPGVKMRERPELFYPVVPADLGSMKLAFTEDFGQAPVESIVRRAFRKVVAALAPMFARAVEATPDVSGGDEAFEVLRSTGVLSSHAEKVKNRPQDCGPNMHANVEEALGYSLQDQANALSRQTAIYRGFQSFFAEHDILVSPAICTSPRPWLELYPALIDGKPVRTYFHWLSLAYYVTLTGHPAMSFPVGRDEKGFPFGLQIVGPRGGDALVLRVAAAIEAAFAGDAEFARPVPDLTALEKAPPMSSRPGFKTWDQVPYQP